MYLTPVWKERGKSLIKSEVTEPAWNTERETKSIRTGTNEIKLLFSDAMTVSQINPKNLYTKC